MANTRSNKQKQRNRPNASPTQDRPGQPNPPMGQNTRTQGAPDRDDAALNTQARTEETSSGANRSLEETPQRVPSRERLVFPTWPTSRPGPMAVQPPPGMKPINALRPEQVSEVGYHQERGIPGESDPARYSPDPSLKKQTSYDQNGAERK